MKNPKVGNTVFLFLVLVDRLEVEDCSVQCMYIQDLTSYLEKGFPAYLLQCLIKAILESCNYY